MCGICLIINYQLWSIKMTNKYSPIATAKNLSRTMAQEHGRHIDIALDCLNQLISQDIEFPTALSLVLDDYDVDQDELTAAYDRQNN